MKRFRTANAVRIMIAACIFVLIIYFGKNLFSVKFLAVRLGKIAVNTFCPASLYERHLYYLAEDKRTAVMMFGNVFPIVRFLSAEGETPSDNENPDIDMLIGAAKDTSVTVSAPVGTDGQTDTESNAQNPESESGGNSAEEHETSDSEEEIMSESGNEQVVFPTQEDMPASAFLPLQPAGTHAYSYEQLTDFNFVHNTFYVIPSHTSLPPEILKPEEFLKTDLSVSKKTPCVLLYHTHSQEAFADSYGSDMTIVQVGDYLEKLLTEQYGFEVLHVDTPFDIKDGYVDRSKAYTYAESEISRVLAENPQVDMVIDLHRDGVNENLHFVTEINGKTTAKVMLFNGISYSNAQGNIDYIYNPYLQDNLALTYQMYALGKTYYPDFFRCIYIEAYRYNLHLCRRSMLIEAGAQTNTFEEVKNAMEPLAELIARELGGEKAY